MGDRDRVRRIDFFIKTSSGEKRELMSIKALIHTLIAIESFCYNLCFN